MTTSQSQPRRVLKRLQDHVRVSDMMVLLFVLTALLIASATFWYPKYIISTRGVMTEGWVVEKLPQQHQTLIFGFAVGDAVFTGRGSPTHAGIGALDSFEIGDTVPVTYARGAPHYSALGDRRETFTREYAPFVMIVLFASVTAVLFRHMRKRA